MSGGFEDLGLLPELVRATQDMGWLLPSAVQDEAIPLILGGGDVMVAAETGSGKTGAFALPAIQIVHETRRAAAAKKAEAEAAAASSSDGNGAPSAKKPRLGPAALNTNDRSVMLAIAPDGLTCQCRQERDWGGVRADRGVLRGSVYYEAQIRDEGLCRFGWSTMAGSLDVGTDKSSWGYGGTGKKSNAKTFTDYGGAFGKGDVIGCFAVLPAAGKPGSISYSKNGVPLGPAFALPAGASLGALYPTICMKNAECGVNFGATAFSFPPPADSEFVGVDAAPADAVVGPGAATGGAAAGSGGGKGGGAAVAGPVCLVLEPARDLAEQTAKAFEALGKYVSSPPVSHALVIGGVDHKEVARNLGKGCDVITATPGKLLDLVESGKLSLASVRLLILDEADRFTEAESLKMVKKLFGAVKRAIETDTTTPGRLQVCFFSATLHSPEIGALSAALCQHPTWVDLKGKDSVPETVHHVVVTVDPNVDRSWAVKAGSSGAGASSSAGLPPFYGADVPTDGVHAKDVKLEAAAAKPAGALSAEEWSEGVKRLKPRLLVSLIDSLDMEQCLIFCRTNVDCDNLEKYLLAVGGGAAFRPGMEKGKENPYSAVVLAGMRSMDERRRNLDAFRAGDVRFLICTDVAARGLDIKELPYVINVTLPDEPENYVHRIGRVGRADRMGLAISLVAAAPPSSSPGSASSSSSGAVNSGGKPGSGHSGEKVWYHSNCSNRGKDGCNNTAPVEKGGCTIWYDEPKLISAVKRRLQMKPEDSLPEMAVAQGGLGPKGTPLPYAFALPPSIAALGAVYGEGRGEKSGPSEHVQAIRGQVSALAALEVRAQNAFLALKLLYPGPATAPAPAGPAAPAEHASTNSAAASATAIDTASTSVPVKRPRDSGI